MLEIAEKLVTCIVASVGNVLDASIFSRTFELPYATDRRCEASIMAGVIILNTIFGDQRCHYFYLIFQFFDKLRIISIFLTLFVCLLFSSMVIASCPPWSESISDHLGVILSLRKLVKHYRDTPESSETLQRIRERLLV